MAILKGGINGPFSGKVGNIVGYQLNGQNIVRSLPVVIKRKPTALTLINRGRMKAVSQFLSPVKGVIDFGYKNIAPKGSRIGAFQAAQSYTFKHAIDYGEGNGPYVNPEKVLVFRGNLMEPPLLDVTREENKIHIQWDSIKCKLQHGVLLALAYAIEEKQFWFEEGGAKISEGTFTWTLSPDATIERYPNLHIYVGFYDILRDELSDSIYAGCV